jgi:hypothetical protein
MFSAEDMADFELKACYEAWNFSHKVVVRTPGTKQLPYGGMPLIDLQGLTAYLAVEHASDGDCAWPGLNRCLRYYNVWPALGPIPREMLPTGMPVEIQRRIDQVKIKSTRKAEEKLQANAARLRLEDMGRQNALDLIDGPYYRRYW